MQYLIIFEIYLKLSYSETWQWSIFLILYIKFLKLIQSVVHFYNLCEIWDNYFEQK